MFSLARRNDVYTAMAFGLAVFALAWLPGLPVAVSLLLVILGAGMTVSLAVVGYIESRQGDKYVAALSDDFSRRIGKLDASEIAALSQLIASDYIDVPDNVVSPLAGVAHKSQLVATDLKFNSITTYRLHPDWVAPLRQWSIEQSKKGEKIEELARLLREEKLIRESKHLSPLARAFTQSHAALLAIPERSPLRVGQPQRCRMCGFGLTTGQESRTVGADGRSADTVVCKNCGSIEPLPQFGDLSS